MNRESKLVNTHHPPEQEKVRTSLKSLTEESMIDVKLIIVHFCIWHLTLSHDFFFFFLKRLFWSDLSSASCHLCFFFCAETKTLCFSNFALVPSQTERTTKSSRGEARPGRLKISVELTVVWSALLSVSFQELSDRHPHTPIHSALSQRKCQVHRHFKPVLVLWLEINNTAWY